MVEDFNFREAWGHLSGHENGHDFEETPQSPHHDLITDSISTERINKNHLVLSDIKNISNKDKITKDLFADFLKSLLRYISTIDTLTLARMDKEVDQITKSQADENRRVAHDSWISNTNALSRYCAKMGIDNEWRNVIGSSRVEQTNWAISVADFAREMALKGDE